MSEDKKPKKKKKAGDVFLTIVLIAAICVFCYAAYNLYHIYTEYKKGSDEYNAIAQMAVTERDPDQDSTSESEEAAGPDGPALKATFFPMSYTTEMITAPTPAVMPFKRAAI